MKATRRSPTRSAARAEPASIEAEPASSVPNQIDSARQLVDGGVPKAKIARDLGCSRRVLYDLLAARGAYAPPPTDSVMPVGVHDS